MPGQLELIVQLLFVLVDVPDQPHGWLVDADGVHAAVHTVRQRHAQRRHSNAANGNGVRIEVRQLGVPVQL